VVSTHFHPHEPELIEMTNAKHIVPSVSQCSQLEIAFLVFPFLAFLLFDSVPGSLRSVVVPLFGTPFPFSPPVRGRPEKFLNGNGVRGSGRLIASDSISTWVNINVPDAPLKFKRAIHFHLIFNALFSPKKCSSFFLSAHSFWFWPAAWFLSFPFLPWLILYFFSHLRLQSFSLFFFFFWAKCVAN